MSTTDAPLAATCPDCQWIIPEPIEPDAQGRVECPNVLRCGRQPHVSEVFAQ